MILGLEIGMLIAGILTLVTGRLQLGIGRAREGLVVRLAGVVLLLPLPLSFAVGFYLGFQAGKAGRPFDPREFQSALAPVELLIAVMCLFLAVLLGCLAPAEDEPGATSRAADPDDATDIAEVIPAPSGEERIQAERGAVVPIAMPAIAVPELGQRRRRGRLFLIILALVAGLLNLLAGGFLVREISRLRDTPDRTPPIRTDRWR
jgi:hypothetical protein